MISFSINEAAYKHFSFIKIRLRFLNVPLLLLKLWVFLDLMALLIFYLKLYLFIYFDFALQVLHNLYLFYFYFLKKKRKTCSGSCHGLDLNQRITTKMWWYKRCHQCLVTWTTFLWISILIFHSSRINSLELYPVFTNMQYIYVSKSWMPLSFIVWMATRK